MPPKIEKEETDQTNNIMKREKQIAEKVNMIELSHEEGNCCVLQFYSTEHVNKETKNFR
jgi:hypothetical protein